MAVETEVPVSVAPRRRPAPKRLTTRELWIRRAPLLPALVFAIVLTQVPFLFTLYYSFRERNLLRPGSTGSSGSRTTGGSPPTRCSATPSSTPSS
jgi:sorbitol/mannitol transport system permease protein